MSVTTTTTRNDYTGNGVTVAFPFTFVADEDSWVRVMVDSVELLAGFTVARNSDQSAAPGGTATFDVAPVASSAVRVFRQLPLTQAMALSPYSPFPAKSVEKALDRLTMMSQQLQSDSPTAQAVESAAEAAASAGATAALVGTVNTYVSAASSSASASASSAGAAATAKSDAEAARDAAVVAKDLATISAGRIYADTTAGLAAVANGEYFAVPAGTSADVLIIYKDNAGAALEVGRMPASSAVSALQASLPNDAALAYAWCVKDPGGRVAFGLLTDGTLTAAELNMTAGTFVSVGPTSGKLTEDTTGSIFGYGFVIADPAGYIAVGVKTDGTWAAKALEATTLNGTAVADILTASASPAATATQPLSELNFIVNYGQSNAEGSNGTLTTVQEYDNIGFPARTSSPGSYAALTVANTEVSGRGESPMYGALGHIKALLAAESPQIDNYQLLTVNDGWSGFEIDTLLKSYGAYFAQVMTQVQAAYNIAQTEGRVCHFKAVLWTQGDADGNDTQATYKTKLLQLIADFNADGKAITGQADDVVLIGYQMPNGANLDLADMDVALAQLDSHVTQSNIFLACPGYQFDYYNAQHVDATSSKWLGGYYGLAYKRVIIDKQDWEVVRPLEAVRQGKVINVRFAVPVKPLSLDTSRIPAQANYGFSLVDSGGSPLTISSVALVGDDVVKITAASTIPAGATLRYGFTAATGKSPYVGGCGNLRDSNPLVYAAIGKPMFNWCVIFSLPV